MVYKEGFMISGRPVGLNIAFPARLVPRGYVYDLIYHTPACMITRYHNQYFFCSIPLCTVSEYLK
jgi:hypothetical protein